MKNFSLMNIVQSTPAPVRNGITFLTAFAQLLMAESALAHYNEKTPPLNKTQIVQKNTVEPKNDTKSDCDPGDKYVKPDAEILPATDPKSVLWQYNNFQNPEILTKLIINIDDSTTTQDMGLRSSKPWAEIKYAFIPTNTGEKDLKTAIKRNYLYIFTCYGIDQIVNNLGTSFNIYAPENMTTTWDDAKKLTYAASDGVLTRAEKQELIEGNYGIIVALVDKREGHNDEILRSTLGDAEVDYSHTPIPTFTPPEPSVPNDSLLRVVNQKADSIITLLTTKEQENPADTTKTEKPKNTPNGYSITIDASANASDVQFGGSVGLPINNNVSLVLLGLYGKGDNNIGQTFDYQGPWREFVPEIHWDKRSIEKQFSNLDYQNAKILVGPEVRVAGDLWAGILAGLDITKSTTHHDLYTAQQNRRNGVEDDSLTFDYCPWHQTDTDVSYAIAPGLSIKHDNIVFTARALYAPGNPKIRIHDGQTGPEIEANNPNNWYFNVGIGLQFGGHGHKDHCKK